MDTIDDGLLLVNDLMAMISSVLLLVLCYSTGGPHVRTTTS